jgi:hypothetical protein
VVRTVWELEPVIPGPGSGRRVRLSFRQEGSGLEAHDGHVMTYDLGLRGRLLFDLDQGRPMRIEADLASVWCSGRCEQTRVQWTVDFYSEAAPPLGLPAPLPVQEGAWIWENEDWSLRVEPSELAGEPGEEREFWAEIRPRRPHPGRVQFLPGPWIRLADGSGARELGPQGGRFECITVVGPWWRQRLALFLFEDLNEPEPRSLPRRHLLPGPRVQVHPVPSIAEVRVETAIDPGVLVPGLQLQDAGDGVILTYLPPGENPGFDCGEQARPLGDFTLLRREGRLTLLGFVQTFRTDRCDRVSDAPMPRVIVHLFDPPPEPMEVRVYRQKSCVLCLMPAGYEEHSARYPSG